MPASEREQMASLRAAYDRWVDIDDGVLALSASQRKDEAYALARNHDEDAVSWEDVIASLVSANESRLKDQVAASHRTYSAGRTVMGVATLLSIRSGRIVT